MEPESLFFRGTFLMKFLAEELDRARREISEIEECNCDAIYSKYSIEPLVLHEDEIRKDLTTGYRVSDPMFLIRHLEDLEYTKCRVVEYRIPFDGDERLFMFTTRALPYYPFGRLEDNAFVISVKEGEELYISDYEYNLTLLKDCLEIIAEAVKCYNSDLKAIITELTG